MIMQVMFFSGLVGKLSKLHSDSNLYREKLKESVWELHSIWERFFGIVIFNSFNSGMYALKGFFCLSAVTTNCAAYTTNCAAHIPSL